MARNLALAVSLVLGVLSIPAYALGLGDIQSKSTLNQNFNADINMLSVASGEIDVVRVRLATANAFKRAGVGRPFYLSLLKFKPVRLDNGDAVVRITSDFPIREPFLNFLVEVNWPSGRLVREYTVLLDPPTSTKKRAPKVSTAAARAPVRQITEVQPEPSVETVSTNPSINEYTVTSNDTVWGIAKKFRPSGIGMEQMMIALQQANPDAFIDNNINKLRNGQILRVPEMDELKGLSRASAHDQYVQQQDAWLAEQNGAAAKTQAKKVLANNSSDTANQTESTAADDAQLLIASSDADGDASAGDGIGSEGSIKGKLLLASENVETSRIESTLLREQMVDLQKRLDDMQRLLTLKDEQLAQLQSNVNEGLAELNDSQALSSSVDESLDPIDTAITGARKSIEQQGDDSQTLVDNDLVDAADDYASGLPKAKATANAVEVDPLDQAMADAEKAAVSKRAEEANIANQDKASKDKQSDSRTSKTETSQKDSGFSLLEILSQYWVYLVVVAAGIIAFLLLLARRRHKDEINSVFSTPDESILLDDGDEGLDLLVDDADTENQDTSFLSEFSPSDINALQDETGEVDPVSEADVYIAYGRYQQAEDLLKQALLKDPGRLVLKHKLLEVYYATKNQDSFAALTQEMINDGQDIADAETWKRAQEMGRELDPNSSQFSAAASPAVVVDDVAALDFDDDEDDVSDEIVDEDSLILDDLELSAIASDLGVDDESIAEDDLGAFTLDLDELDSSITESENTLDSLELPGIDKVKSLKDDEDSKLTADDLQAQLDELSDLTMLDGSLSEMVPSEGIDIDEGALDKPMDLGGAFKESLNDAEEDLDIDTLMTDILDEDATETKLDLARAFVEMGDEDGARSILDEVMSEGTESQKNEAKKFIDEIS